VQHTDTHSKESAQPMKTPPTETRCEPADKARNPIIALIPAYNEEATIATVIAGVRRTLPVLVVDDGSTDSTATVARDAGATVVSHEANRRKGAALMTGFRWALDRGYDAVVTLDADGQHDPADLPKFLSAYHDRAGDLIIGERDSSQMPFPRWWSSPLGARLLSWALGIRVTDNQSGYRLLTRPFLERMDLESRGFEMEVEMIWEAIRLGMPIAWVPIRTIYYSERKSGFHPVKDTARFVRMVWHIWRERRRWERARRSAPDRNVAKGIDDRGADLLGRLVTAIDRIVQRLMGIYEFSNDPRCIFRLERRRAKRDITLPDGTMVRRGETLGITHLHGERVPLLPAGGADLAWARQMARVFSHSLALLAGHVAQTRSLDRVRVFGNEFSLPMTQGSVRLLERMGFFVIPHNEPRLRQRAHARLSQFWTRLLRRAYNPVSLTYPDGIRYGTMSIWMKRETLMTRYGPDT